MNNEPDERYIDPHVSLKDADVKGALVIRNDYPVFGLVEFNIWGACNRRCSFCPVADPEIFINRKEGISEKDYQKVLTDLYSIDYSGVILWSMFSEPTLHKKILNLARMTKKTLPNVSLQLTSNGDLFQKKGAVLLELIKSGVDRVNISLYDNEEQFTEFTNIRKRLNLSTDQIKLRRRYLADGNYGISISNRTGLIDSNKYRDKSEKVITTLPLNQPCYYPFYQVGIDYNGDVLLCPHDWAKKYVAGNAFADNIWDIWKNTSFVKARTSLKKGERSFSPCETCDVAGNLIGKNNFDAFSFMD